MSTEKFGARPMPLTTALVLMCILLCAAVPTEEP